MHHEPANYTCPFCEWLSGKETELKQNSDIVLQNNSITAFVSPKWWVNNPGHVIIIPNTHYENIYDTPDSLLRDIAVLTKQVAIAIRKAYDCTGISTRQHNEPDGNQDVWHFHTHIFPRHRDDRLYQNHDNKTFVPIEDRAHYARILRQALTSSNFSS